MDALAAMVAQAEALAGNTALSVTERVAALTALAVAINPERRKVARAGAGRIPLAGATVEELVTAIQDDAGAAAERARPPATAYKAVEGLFRPGGARSACADVAAALAAGAFDFAHSPAAIPGLRVLLPPTASHPVAPGGIYGLTSAPGFYVLPRALGVAQQEYWVRRMLRGWVEPPQRRNIDAVADPDYSNAVAAAAGVDEARVVRLADGAFVSYASTLRGEPAPAPAPVVAPAPAAAAAAAAAATDDGGCGRPDAVAAGGGAGAEFERDLWPRYRAAAVGAGGASARHHGRSEPALTRVSWATLGYQYDWTARQYHLPSDPDFALHQGCHAAPAGTASRWWAPFPADLWCWGRDVAAAIDAAARAALPPHEAGAAHGLPMAIDPQSGIANIYAAAKKLPMGAHVDDMERDHAFPVVSLSLGCTGVYLLGGRTRDAAPVPVLLRSGDIAILSGDARLAFHGGAQVFSDTAPPERFASTTGAALAAAPPDIPPSAATYLTDAAYGAYGHPGGAPGDATEETAFRDFVASRRLNINVRQVQRGH